VIIATVVAQFVDKIGRRPLWLTSTAGMLCSYVVITALSATFANTGKAAAGTAVIPFLFIFFGFYDIAWTIQCYSYTTEILPYDLRTKGLAIFVCVQNLALAFNTYVNPIALSAIGWKYYSVYIATLSVVLVVIWFYFPEIKGLTLDEISLVFDQGTRGDRKSAANQLAASANEGSIRDIHEAPQKMEA
jgi:MFS family permease